MSTQIHLILDLWKAHKHAQEHMADFGITYAECEPQSMTDSWLFFNCKNVPETLPEMLSKFKPRSTRNKKLSE